MRDTKVIIYCSQPKKDAPLASVRYTKYDSLNRVIDVDQVDYEIKTIFIAKFYRLLLVELMFLFILI